MQTDRRLNAYRALALALVFLLVMVLVAELGSKQTTTVILNESWEATPEAQR